MYLKKATHQTVACLTDMSGLSTIFSRLSELDHEGYLELEKKIFEVQASVMSSSVACQELEAQLSDVKKTLLENTRELTALYANRQAYMNKVFTEIKFNSANGDTL